MINYWSRDIAGLLYILESVTNSRSDEGCICLHEYKVLAIENDMIVTLWLKSPFLEKVEPTEEEMVEWMSLTLEN